MPDDFQFDVFLSHSAKDKAVVRFPSLSASNGERAGVRCRSVHLAEQLQQDGVRVWLDEEQIKPGDSIPAKIEDGLEHSPFGFQSLAFSLQPLPCDPLNQERRFIPLRLDDAPIKGSLAQFLYINWLTANREQEYVKLTSSSKRGGVAGNGEPFN